MGIQIPDICATHAYALRLDGQPMIGIALALTSTLYGPPSRLCLFESMEQIETWFRDEPHKEPKFLSELKHALTLLPDFPNHLNGNERKWLCLTEKSHFAWLALVGLEWQGTQFPAIDRPHAYAMRLYNRPVIAIAEPACDGVLGGASRVFFFHSQGEMTRYFGVWKNGTNAFMREQRHALALLPDFPESLSGPLKTIALFGEHDIHAWMNTHSIRWVVAP